MIRMVLVLSVLLFGVGIGQVFGAEEAAEPTIEISEEDREIAEIIELLELLELLNEMDNVAALEERS